MSNPDALKANPDLVIRIKAEKEKRQLIIEGALAFPRGLETQFNPKDP